MKDWGFFPLGIFLVIILLALLVKFIEGDTMSSCAGAFCQAQGKLSSCAQAFAGLLDAQFEIAEEEH